METFTSSQVHVSLDLTALKSEIALEDVRYEAQRKREKWYYAGLGLAFILPFFIPSGDIFSTGFAPDPVGLGQMILLGSMMIWFIPLTISRYHSSRRYNTRLDQYAPNFVPRASKREIILAWIPWVALIVFALVAVLTLPLMLILLVVVFLLSFRLTAYRRLLLWAYRGGIPRIEALLRFLPRNPFLAGYKASLQIVHNQLDESAAAFRDLLARKKYRDLNSIPYWLNNLGVALMYGGHYAEALPYLEAAARIRPTLTNVYDSLTVWYMEQGLDAERAVEFGELTLELSAASASPVEKATVARALALTGQHDRAETLIEQAVIGAKDQEAVARAEIHQQLGHARLAQGDREAATKHFERAIEIDPDGLFAQLSRRALDSITATA